MTLGVLAISGADYCSSFGGWVDAVGLPFSIARYFLGMYNVVTFKFQGGIRVLID